MDKDIINLAKAIRQQESGGDFNAVGDNGTSRGAYQFQDATWKAWAGKHLGNQNAELTKENQNKVAYYQIKEWKEKGYNPAQIAAAWNAGEGRLKNDQWKTWKGTTTIKGKPIAYDTPAYVAKVGNYYQQFKQESSVQEIGTTPAQTQLNLAKEPAVVGKAQSIGASIEKNLFDPFSERFKKIDYGNQGLLSNVLQSVGAVAGGALDVAGNVAMGAVKAVTPDPVEDLVGGAIQKGGEAIASLIPEEKARAFKDWADRHPEAAANLGSVIDIASIVPAVKGISAARKVTSLADEAGDLARASEAAQRIAQPSRPDLFRPKTVISAVNNLPDVEIKTYKQFRDVLDKQNTSDLEIISNQLKKDTTKYRLENFEINRKGFKFNPVNDALVGLRELAEKTSDSELYEKVREFDNLVKSGQMTQFDVNELAKVLGTKKNAFAQNGQLLKRTSAVKAENTRSELKQVARTGMPEQIAQLDKMVSDRINLATTFRSAANAVERELQKAQKLNIFQKIINFGAETADLFMGRLLSNVIRQMKTSGRLKPSEIEAELSKNIKTIQDIVNKKDVNKMKEFLNSIGYFSTANVISPQPAQEELPQ